MIKESRKTEYWNTNEQKHNKPGPGAYNLPNLGKGDFNHG